MTDTEFAQQLLSVQVAHASYRSETYCDIVTLTKSDLADVFTQENLWSKLSHSKRNGKNKRASMKERLSNAAEGGSSTARRLSAVVNMVSAANYMRRSSRRISDTSLTGVAPSAASRSIHLSSAVAEDCLV